MPAKKKKPKKRGANPTPKPSQQELRNFLASFLRAIPNHKQDEKSIEKIAGNDYPKYQDQIETLLPILDIFRAVRYKTKGATRHIKSESELSSYFLRSLAIYIKNNFPLVTNWDRIERIDMTKPIQHLSRGEQILHLMEARRVDEHNSKDVLDEVEIILCIIKGNVKEFEDPMYLLQYNLRSRYYQLMGTRMKDEDNSYLEAINRAIKRDLPHNSFVIKESDISQVLKTYETYKVSNRTGAYTRYKVSVYHLTLDDCELKIGNQDRWLTLDELLKCKTKDKLKVMPPFKHFLEDSNKYKEIEGAIKKLPLSLNTVQSAASKQTTEESNKKESPGTKKLTELLKQEESNTLEFKSSVRWDYRQKKANKDLEKGVVKTVAGYLNSGGGTLLIGITDDKQVLGLNKDIKTLAKRNEDGFMQLIIQLISSHLGPEVCPFVEVDFGKVENKSACIVEVKGFSQPVFYKEGEERKFYARTANVTKELNSEETYKYITTNWAN